MKKKLVIFDMDGVLTSTNNEHYESWKILFKKHFNIDLNPSSESDTKGVSRKRSLEILLEAYGLNISDPQKMDQLLDEKNQFYLDKIEKFDPSHQMKGAKEILDFFKQKQLKIALGSASHNAPKLLEKLKLMHYFDYIVDPKTLKSKPHPDIFNDAKDYFHLEGQACIGIEDAKSGVDAIKKAQMYAIGVGSEDLSHADWHVEALDTLDLKILNQIIEGKL